ncbi:mitoferrin [Thraustotheca clavata]|uniref:Mitoferrin n=1 Tax=Thraustotheca clavata TaxID=74557 RepID=A0A1V9ZQ15_9STRA|nr:mitoferrin [Thraustotheca clavata]
MDFKVDEDWEEWTPEKGSFLHHMAAGSAAGVVEHVSIFPIDTIKTHMQCQRCPVNSTVLRMNAFQTAKKLIAEDGPLRLFRGVSTMLGASLPAHALYFSVFEACKKSFGADSAELTPFQSGAAGVIATISHDFIMTPMDVIKQRLQLGYYAGVLHCMKTMIRQEGFRGLYISFPTTFFMNLPYSMIMVSTNESIKKVLNPSGDINVGAYIFSGAVAGAVAGALTNPLDVAKTRLQTQMLSLEEPTRVRPCAQNPKGISLNKPPSCQIQSSAPHIMLQAEKRMPFQYRGLLDAMFQIYKQEGIKAFFRGVGPRVCVHAPSVAVSWTTFEVLKNVLAGEDH